MCATEAKSISGQLLLRKNIYFRGEREYACSKLCSRKCIKILFTYKIVRGLFSFVRSENLASYRSQVHVMLEEFIDKKTFSPAAVDVP